MKTFEELGVSEEIRRAIEEEELGFENPMPVQEEVIPYLLGNKNDVIALAQTGTGKTASYGIPRLSRKLMPAASRHRLSSSVLHVSSASRDTGYHPQSYT